MRGSGPGKVKQGWTGPDAVPLGRGASFFVTLFYDLFQGVAELFARKSQGGHTRSVDFMRRGTKIVLRLDSDTIGESGPEAVQPCIKPYIKKADGTWSGREGMMKRR